MKTFMLAYQFSVTLTMIHLFTTNCANNTRETERDKGEYDCFSVS